MSANQPRLTIRPISLKAANAFVAQLHRHHRPDTGHKFSLAVTDGTDIRGVAIVGRPKARMLDDGLTAEVTRLCTDGCPNACSALYGAARRTARAMGYRRIITYTLPTEGGASLRAAGWLEDGPAGGGEWSRPSRLRPAADNPQIKIRWSVTFGDTTT